MFKVKINTDNAAFESRDEVSRILQTLAIDINNGADVYILRDINGNTVGTAEFTGKAAKA